MLMIKKIARVCIHWTAPSFKEEIKMRIGIVSSDGENVDLHLGKAKSVYIYDGEDFVEKRDVEISQDSKHQGGKVIKACNDCDVLIAVQYGFKSKIKADDAGIKLVMDEGSVSEVLNRYLEHVDFIKNIKFK